MNACLFARLTGLRSDGVLNGLGAARLAAETGWAMSRFFATAAAGTENLVLQEIETLGATSIKVFPGGVRFHGTLETGLKACLWSRVAMRILMPLARFPVADEQDLYDGVRAINWSEHLNAKTTFAVDATGVNDALRHTHYTALKVKDAIVDSMRDAAGTRPSVDAKNPDVQIVAHLARGQCELSLDFSGEPLFKRGYRQTPMKASLKETLAAAVLMSAGYDGDTPLIDPMCGAGTIAIEAAMIAANRAPGLGRGFGVERWPSFDADGRALLRQLHEEAKSVENVDVPHIIASDRDPDAVAATRANIHRAKVKVEVREGDAREIRSLGEVGWIVTNPPYGERLEAGGRKQLKSFFWQLGQNWRHMSGHEVAVLSGGPEFESAFGLRPLSRQRLWNGPIQCELLRYRMQ